MYLKVTRKKYIDPISLIVSNNPVYVYIASPYSKGNHEKNVIRSLRLADRIRKLGFTPITPLLSHYWHNVSKKDWTAWMEYDLELLRSAQIVVRLSGESVGADIELTFAQRCGKRYFTGNARQIIEQLKKEKARYVFERVCWVCYFGE